MKRSELVVGEEYAIRKRRDGFFLPGHPEVVQVLANLRAFNTPDEKEQALQFAFECPAHHTLEAVKGRLLVIGVPYGKRANGVVMAVDVRVLRVHACPLCGAAHPEMDEKGDLIYDGRTVEITISAASLVEHWDTYEIRASIREAEIRDHVEWGLRRLREREK
jgi:hypothetical protein